MGAHLIHISTDYVFDGTSGPYRETDITKPVNYYGETKLASEELIAKGQLHATLLRTNVLFGNSVNQESSFVHWVIEKLRKREKIKVVNDQFGNPTWARGLAETIAKIIETGTPGLYHYGGDNYINRFEFALEIAAVFELDPTLILPCTTRALGQKAERPFKAGLVSEKIKSDLNVKIYGIKEALTVMKGSD